MAEGGRVGRERCIWVHALPGSSQVARSRNRVGGERGGLLRVCSRIPALGRRRRSCNRDSLVGCTRALTFQKASVILASVLMPSGSCRAELPVEFVLLGQSGRRQTIRVHHKAVRGWAARAGAHTVGRPWALFVLEYYLLGF